MWSRGNLANRPVEGKVERCGILDWQLATIIGSGCACAVAASLGGTSV